MSPPFSSPEVSPGWTSESSSLNFGPCTKEQLLRIETPSDDIEYYCLQSKEQSEQSFEQVESENSPLLRDCRRLRGGLSESLQRSLLNLGFTIICLIDGSESGVKKNSKSSCTALICQPSPEQRPLKRPCFTCLYVGCCPCRRVCCLPGYERCLCKPRCGRSCGRRRGLLVQT